MTTTESISIPTPDGGTISVEVAIDWLKVENPMDKEPSRYGGEDDGWEVEDISLT